MDGDPERGAIDGLRLDMVTMDSADAASLAAWWAWQTGGEVGEHFGFFVVTHPRGNVPPLGFQQVEERTPGKNATHLDLRADGVPSAVATLVSRGATAVAEHRLPDGFTWQVLADPDGNQFCVLPAG